MSDRARPTVLLRDYRKFKPLYIASGVLQAIWNLSSDAQSPPIVNWERRRPRQHLSSNAGEDVGAPIHLSGKRQFGCSRPYAGNLMHRFHKTGLLVQLHQRFGMVTSAHLRQARLAGCRHVPL